MEVNRCVHWYFFLLMIAVPLGAQQTDSEANDSEAKDGTEQSKRRAAGRRSATRSQHPRAERRDRHRKFASFRAAPTAGGISRVGRSRRGRRTSTGRPSDRRLCRGRSGRLSTGPSDSDANEPADPGLQYQRQPCRDYHRQRRKHVRDRRAKDTNTAVHQQTRGSYLSEREEIVSQTKTAKTVERTTQRYDGRRESHTAGNDSGGSEEIARRYYRDDGHHLCRKHQTAAWKLSTERSAVKESRAIESSAQ